MKERPILFNAPMVRALLDGSKTQTRRVCKHAMDTNLSAVVGPFVCPGFGPGWFGDEQRRKEEVMYRANGETDPYVIGYRWTPSIHMPRWASRILLEVVSVRVERLHDCSEADALAEGVKGEPCDHIRLSCEKIGCCGPTAKGMYGALWDQINGAGSWAANPWVWAIEFRKLP